MVVVFLLSVQQHKVMDDPGKEMERGREEENPTFQSSYRISMERLSKGPRSVKGQ